MCLITVALGASPRYPVVVAANREERHARPSAAAAWWADNPRVLGGRDLVAGGTWLAMDRRARIGAVTNRAPSGPEPGPRSRGMLVIDYLTGAATAAEFAERALSEAASYGPFNLVVVDEAGASVVSSSGERVRFAAGIRSFGNAPLDADWPKLAVATAGVEQALESADPVPALLEVLALRRAEPAPQGPDRENPFISGAEFGTRCSTVILADSSGRVEFAERRYDAAARSAGRTRIEFESGNQSLSAAR